MQNFKESFDAFFQGEDKVAVIKGRWGVGKTYFWNKYIAQRMSANDLEQIAYSYISLFGKTSLSGVRKSIFHSAKPISSDTKIKNAFKGQFASSSRLLNLAPKANWLTRNVQNIPAVGQFSNMISNVEYSLVDNYVICFDDLERRADTLAVKEVMGLIDELAIRKNCKVILIFNEKELDENASQKEFDSYREKVVDIELNYEPICVENIKLVFPDNFKHLSIIKNVVNELDIKNIRVLRKIYRAIEEFCIFSKGLPDTLVEEFIIHATILCRGYFIRSEDLPYEIIKLHITKSSWMSFVYDKEKEGTSSEEKRTPEEKKYIEIAINLKLSPSRFDAHIMHYLEQGFVNKEDLNTTVSDILKLAEIEQFNIRRRKAWSIYTDSFENNLAEFIVALKGILNEDITNLEWHDFSQMINILDEFGEDVSGYIKSYAELNEEALKKIDPSDPWDMDRIKNEELKNKIYKIHEDNKHFNIDDVAETIVSHQDGSEEVNFLVSLEMRDFHTWMKENPENLIKKVRGLLKFGKMDGSQSDKEKFGKINSNVRGALLNIAGENALNKKRIKYLYGIE